VRFDEKPSAFGPGSSHCVERDHTTRSPIGRLDPGQGETLSDRPAAAEEEKKIEHQTFSHADANRAAKDIAATKEFATADRNSGDHAFSDPCTDS